MTKPKAKPDDPAQSKRFIEAARELGCDDDEDALKARMKRLAETKPAPLKSLPKRTPPERRSPLHGEDGGRVAAGTEQVIEEDG